MIATVRDLIIFHEGFTSPAKPDEKGKWVIGFGHDLPPAPGATCTRDEAARWLDTIDLPRARGRAILNVGSGNEIVPIAHVSLFPLCPGDRFEELVKRIRHDRSFLLIGQQPEGDDAAGNFLASFQQLVTIAHGFPIPVVG